jgi:hypothetical protein
MRTVPKIILVSAAIAFALSLTKPGGEVAWGILKPLSAILFIIFYILQLLADELDKFNDETQRRAGEVIGLRSRPATETASRADGRTDPRLARSEARGA